jgi:hypothetical protein
MSQVFLNGKKLIIVTLYDNVNKNSNIDIDYNELDQTILKWA